MVGKRAWAVECCIQAVLRSPILEKTIIIQDGSILSGGEAMDPRVFKVMQMLRKEALKPPPRQVGYHNSRRR
jgi:hypothetical protein